jgi:hypothetical protein
VLWRWYELRAASSGAVGAGDAFFFAADLRFAVAFFDDFGVAFFCFFAEDFGVVAFDDGFRLRDERVDTIQSQEFKSASPSRQSTVEYSWLELARVGCW